MSGTAIEIYLKTIATGDGAKKVAADYAAMAKAAKEAQKQTEQAARQAAKVQEQAAKESAAAVKKAEAEKASAAKKSADEATAAAKKQAQEQERAAKQAAATEARAVSGRGRSLMELGRIAQDAQYGIGGVLNNIEGLTTALGLGTGLAGGITLVAVTLKTLGPSIAEWMGKIDEASARLKDNVATLERASKAIGGNYSSNAENAEDIERNRQQAMQREKQHFEDLNSALERRLELLNAIRATEANAETRQAAADSADISAQNLPAEQAAMEQARIRREQLDNQHEREEQAAQDTANAATERLNNKSRELGKAEERTTALEEERNVSRREEFLLAEQAKLEKAVAAMRQKFNMPMSPQLREEADRKIAEAQAKADANKELLAENKNAAPNGRVRSYDQVNNELKEARDNEDSLRRGFDKEVADEVHRQNMAREAAKQRDENYYRDREEMERARQAAMLKQQAGLPRLPGAPPASFLPLPGEPAGNGVMDPSNARAPWSGMPQVPGAPPNTLPSAPQIDTKPMEEAAKKAAEETAKGVEAVKAALNQIGQAWAGLQQQVATLRDQNRNSRPA